MKYKVLYNKIAAVLVAAAVVSVIGMLTTTVSCSRDSEQGMERVRPEAEGMDAARLALIDKEVDKAIRDGLIPGAVVAVVRNDKIVYIKPFGNKSVVPDTLAMTENAIFDLASVSKCVGTTMAVMQMIENGQIRPGDYVERYIPGFEPWISDGASEKITVRHLLTHSSGLSPYLSVSDYIAENGEYNPSGMEEYLAHKSGRNFRPGSDFMYSCLNFITLQLIVEKISGQCLSDYVEKNVFAPLGLDNTLYMPLGPDGQPLRKQFLDKFVPTEVQSDGKPLIGQVHDPLARLINKGNSGNAGVFSDAEGLCKICAAIMNGGAYKDARILSPCAVKLMCEVPEDIEPSVGRALGWDHHSSHSGPRGDLFDREHTICHTGYTGTSVTIDTRSRTALVILSHRVHPRDKGSLGRFRSTLANIVASAIVSD